MIRVVGDGRCVTCDAVGCGRNLEYRRVTSASEARVMAKAAGWHCGPHPKANHTVDVCPVCWAWFHPEEAPTGVRVPAASLETSP